MTQPKLITKPFADDALPGYVNEIPKENPVGAPEQNASWSEGFPPITMTDIDDGGLPPNGEDMNGVLRAITEHNLFIGGGGVYEFTDDYIAEVGGYSKGAVLISDDKTALWMSIQDNNTQNFNGATKNQWRRIAFTELDSTLTSIQDALNTKANKSVTITAGEGLTGGGTLAGNRVLAVDNSVVRTGRTITAGTGLSGGGNLSANRTLSVNYGTTAGTAAQGNDSRITGAAQKSANLSDLANAGAARQNLGLGTAATRDVGESSGNVMEVGAGGWLGQGDYTAAAWGYPTSIADATNKTRVSRSNAVDQGVAAFAPSFHFSSADTWGRLRVDFNGARAWIQGGRADSGTGWTAELYHTGNMPAIGVGQTWQNVGSQRSVNITYTNTGTKPIFVAISAWDLEGGDIVWINGDIDLIVADGLGSSGGAATTSFIVPAGSTYRFEKTNGTFVTWAELR